MRGRPSPKNVLQWFNPSNRSVGGLGFIINRITGLGLSLYLVLHLIMLGQLAQGQQAYDDFISMMKNPVFIIGELLVIAAGILHGINGIRIGLTSFGVGARYQRVMLILGGLISVVGIIFFGIRMLGGE